MDGRSFAGIPNGRSTGISLPLTFLSWDATADTALIAGPPLVGDLDCLALASEILGVVHEYRDSSARKRPLKRRVRVPSARPIRRRGPLVNVSGQASMTALTFQCPDLRRADVQVR